MPRYFRPELEGVPGYHLDERAYRIKLNQNESPWDLPDRLKKKILERLDRLSWNRYPRPFAEDLCEKLGRKIDWNPEGIVMTNGSNSLVKDLILIGNTASPVLTITPTFSLYEMAARVLGRKIVTVPLQKDFSLDEKALHEAVEKSKPSLIFIPNPNAPTGNLFPQSLLTRLVQAAPSLVVIDEAYYPYSEETLFDLLKEYPNLVLLRTFSKAFGLAGLRVGYALCDPTVALELRKVLLPFTINQLSCAAVETSLEESEAIGQWTSQIIAERENLFKVMKSLEKIEVYPSRANYLLFRVEGDHRSVYEQLAREGILIRDASNKSSLANALRVSVGTPIENGSFLKALQASL